MLLRRTGGLSKSNGTVTSTRQHPARHATTSWNQASGSLQLMPCCASVGYALRVANSVGAAVERVFLGMRHTKTFRHASLMIPLV